MFVLLATSDSQWSHQRFVPSSLPNGSRWHSSDTAQYSSGVLPHFWDEIRPCWFSGIVGIVGPIQTRTINLIIGSQPLYSGNFHSPADIVSILSVSVLFDCCSLASDIESASLFEFACGVSDFSIRPYRTIFPKDSCVFFLPLLFLKPNKIFTAVNWSSNYIECSYLCFIDAYLDYVPTLEVPFFTVLFQVILMGYSG